MISAYEFGKRHNSCILSERKQFDIDNPGAGQAGFYRHCQLGDYLIWQLRKLSHEQMSPLRSAFIEVARRAAGRASEYADNCAPERAAESAEWAAESAKSAARARAASAWAASAWAASVLAAWAAWAAAEVNKELAAQASDIHELIPEWPG